MKPIYLVPLLALLNVAQAADKDPPECGSCAPRPDPYAVSAFVAPETHCTTAPLAAGDLVLEFASFVAYADANDLYVSVILRGDIARPGDSTHTVTLARTPGTNRWTAALPLQMRSRGARWLELCILSDADRGVAIDAGGGDFTGYRIPPGR